MNNYFVRAVRAAAPVATAARGMPARVRAYSTAGPDYFELLEIPIANVARNGWSINPGELKRQWLQKMSHVHPDRTVNRPESEQHAAEQYSALVNRAYETLMSPLARAEYLVERLGSDSTEEGTTQANPMLLAEVMELQEGVENAETHEEIDQIDTQNSEHLRAALAALDQVFEGNPPDVEAAKRCIAELRYWTNIDRAVSDWRLAHP